MAKKKKKNEERMSVQHAYIYMLHDVCKSKPKLIREHLLILFDIPLKNYAYDN